MRYASAIPQLTCLALFYRTASKEEDSRWLSGTYLLVHPAAKHLGNARVRVKILLELKPQGSGRAKSRQWQVPQVMPAVIRAVPSSPNSQDPALTVPTDAVPTSSTVAVTASVELASSAPHAASEDWEDPGLTASRGKKEAPFGLSAVPIGHAIKPPPAANSSAGSSPVRMDTHQGPEGHSTPTPGPPNTSKGEQPPALASPKVGFCISKFFSSSSALIAAV